MKIFLFLHVRIITMVKWSSEKLDCANTFSTVMTS